jgi:hypothetical protein
MIVAGRRVRPNPNPQLSQPSDVMADEALALRFGDFSPVFLKVRGPRWSTKQANTKTSSAIPAGAVAE